MSLAAGFRRYAAVGAVLVGVAFQPAQAQEAGAPIVTEPEGATQQPTDTGGKPTSPRLPLLIEAPLPQLEPGEPETAEFAYGVFQRGWYLTAVAVATPLAEKGDPAAQTLLGVLHETGLGIRQDKAKAAGWYEVATGSGDAGAALRLAQLYLAGDGVEQDKRRAADLFEIAANAGYPAAMYNLALLYQEGSGRPFNDRKARELLEQAAEREDTDAQYALGLAYLEAAAPEKDERRGAFWLGRAARRGHVSAQVYYGILRFQGKGVDPDENEAAEWFERAAGTGNPVAMNRLARIYAYGRGRDTDPATAAAWHYMARALGVSDLQLDGYVSSLEPEVLDTALEKASRLSVTFGTTDQDPAAFSP